mmetsp:Transcript_21374/g.45174  ORF Transcript_21374/g.45174 Transcript_21374/m.45174 type:complete len:259 (-) Transcript_21374:195-971(-)
MSQQNNNSVTSGGSVDKPNNHPNEIPIIDLANPDTALLQQQLYEACSTWGFFQLINHGISPELIASFRTAMANFFALPYDIKLPLKRNARNARGYFDDELTKRKRDWKEAIDVGEPGSRDWNLPDAHETNACLDGYNQFPSSQDCPHFRDVVVQYPVMAIIVEMTLQHNQQLLPLMKMIVPTPIGMTAAITTTKIYTITASATNPARTKVHWASHPIAVQQNFKWKRKCRGEEDDETCTCGHNTRGGSGKTGYQRRKC